MERAGMALRVSGVVDIHKLGLKQAGSVRKGMLEVYLFEQDAEGHSLSRERQALRLDLTGEMYQRYAKAGVRFQQAIELKDGFARLRVLVDCPEDGSVGTVIIPAAEIH